MDKKVLALSVAGLLFFTGAALVIAASTPASIQTTIDAKLVESQQKELKKAAVEAQRAALAFWNNGADYGPTLQNLVNGGGVVEIPRGRYRINTGINFQVNNTRLRPKKTNGLDDDVVILETGSLGGGGRTVLHTNGRSGVTIENLILWGNKEINTFAIQIYNSSGATIRNNVIINFDSALETYTTATARATNHLISGNYFFDNGYVTFRTEGQRSGDNCQVTIGGLTIENNFLSHNYQAIDLFCTEDSVVKNNIARDTAITGLRIETSSRNTIDGNLFHRNGQDGIIVYGNSDENTIQNNLTLDNNQQNLPFTFDCWEIQPSLYNTYLNDRADGKSYPYLNRENGYYLFQNYFCQTNGENIELRNGNDGNIFTGNIIGRYSQVSWQSPLDLRIAFYPLFYHNNPARLSKRNNFVRNFFINSGAARVMDQGCDNTYTDNKNITLNPLTESSFTPTANPDYQILCRGEAICRADGFCDQTRGEQHENCASDCPAIQAEARGNRKNYDVCASGTYLSEKAFPTRSGCINTFDGAFTCRNETTAPPDCETRGPNGEGEVLTTASPSVPPAPPPEPPLPPTEPPIIPAPEITRPEPVEPTPPPPLPPTVASVTTPTREALLRQLYTLLIQLLQRLLLIWQTRLGR
ncbi:MAG: right-handed parallel beta-helix repeat-containing protein [Candidatus Vogelbacteria bacterium]|nr:right-handed parallel beta-helix repeat-containing protein [Candidatus Vogelbacteria bacterium]